MCQLIPLYYIASGNSFSTIIPASGFYSSRLLRGRSLTVIFKRVLAENDIDSALEIQDNRSEEFMAIFICAFGLMMVFEGIPYFCFPAQVKDYAAKLTGLSNKTMRVIGFIIVLLGLALAYVGKSMISI